jgi:hypothetical protein
MTAQPLTSPRFRRKTTLAGNEYNTKFQMIDNDITEAVSSPEADAVTPLMSKIYLRLLQTPTELRESERVLRFEGETLEGNWIKAWDQLCKHLRVSSETANKALRWMHEQGVIGYSAFKNGVGIRIFLNRAASSIGVRQAQGGKKILPFAPASAGERPASESEAAFNDSFAVREGSDPDLNPSAPKNGADKKLVGKNISDPTPTYSNPPPASARRTGREVETPTHQASTISVDEIVARLRVELEPCVKAAATQAASQAASREVAETRKWFEERALPKAVRVAQAETYNLLRKLGTLDERKERARADLQVGRATGDYATSAVKRLTPDEITEVAETCVALLETQGKKVDVTLSEIGSECGGWLLPEDAPKVRAEAERLLLERGERR